MALTVGLVLVVAAALAGPSFGKDPQSKEPAIKLSDILKQVPKNQQQAIRFLVNNMPASDAREVGSDLLVVNTKLAYQALSEVPWGKNVPEDIFLNNILPYANLDETREDWRTDLHKRYIDLAKACRTPGEAAQKLNEKIFADLNVRYHATKRPKPNQSPSESIKATYASCTGLSILLVDACRAVGVPARIAGTALWFDNSGNHTWVEVWDKGEWKYIGAAEPGPFNQTWFSEKASKADPSKPTYAIYAVSFKKTNDSFVLSWDRQNRSISAVNVTTRYMNEKETFLRIYPKPTESKLLEGTLAIRDRAICRFKGIETGESNALMDRLSKELSGRSYRITLRALAKDDQKADLELVIDKEAEQLGDSGYELSINPERIALKARAKIGLQRGIEALLQLVPETSVAGDFLKIPCVKVKDVR